MKPLEGYTVVDLTTYVAAPVCARILADLGARVIKVESPKGDAWRQSGVGFLPTRFTQEENPIFDIYNTGKDLISLNLKSEEGMKVMHQLLEKADVFVTNNRPAALARLGLSYEQLKEKYPRLVFAIVLGFGEKGPDADKPAFDTTAFWARSGFLQDTAVKNEMYEPVNAPSGVGDSYTGTNLAMQVLAALMVRDRTGQGQCVRASLYHVGAFAMASMTVMSQRPFGNEFPRTRVVSHPFSAAFRCKDGKYVFLSAAFPVVLEMIGRPELLDDPRFSVANRLKYKEEIHQIFKEGILQLTQDEVMDFLKDKDTPTVRLAHFADVSEDEQAWANGYVQRVEYPTGRSNVVPSIPIEMDCLPGLTTHATKCLGHDTEAVLQELGYTQEEIAAMAEAGAVRLSVKQQ